MQKHNLPHARGKPARLFAKLAEQKPEPGGDRKWVSCANGWGRLSKKLSRLSGAGGGRKKAAGPPGIVAGENQAANVDVGCPNAACAREHRSIAFSACRDYSWLPCLKPKFTPLFAAGGCFGQGK